jgi:excinuclease ABC subunit C
VSTLRQQLAHLPGSPGVYLYRDSGDRVLYVGKAIRLKDRVRSYFALNRNRLTGSGLRRSQLVPSPDLEPHKQVLVRRIAKLETIVVRSEREALLLEATLIKRHRPPFNVFLKDDRYYQYIIVTNEQPFPQLLTIRRVPKNVKAAYGPFTSGRNVRIMLRLLKRIFPYRSCGKPANQPCFDFHLGRCAGHGTDMAAHKRYASIIAQVQRFLEGDTKSVIRNMRREMAEAVKSRNFERAAGLRDRLFAIERLLAEQRVVSTRREDYDAVAFTRDHNLASVNLFPVRAGVVIGKENFVLAHVETSTPTQIVTTFLEQYLPTAPNHARNTVLPILPDTPDRQRIERVFGVRLSAPTRGAKARLLAMGELNAAEDLRTRMVTEGTERARAAAGLAALAAALRLPKPPRRIETYDVSHVHGTATVGSLVVFEEGLPKKSDYRKFNFPNRTEPDDPHTMAEMLKRRFAHTGKDGWARPDLVVLDGGRGQLSVARSSGGIPKEISVVAIAKQEGGADWLYLPGRASPVKLSPSSPALLLVQRMRDEAHRFAIGSARSKHRGTSLKSLLDEIPGIGVASKRVLLQRFGSVSNIREADQTELAKVVGAKRAATIKELLP